MRNMIPILLSTVVLSGCMTTGNSSATSSPNPIRFPTDLFAEQIKGKQCVVKPLQSVNTRDIAKINADELFANDTSLTVSHDELSDKWAELLRKTYKAEATNNDILANEVVSELVYIATSRALLNTTNKGNGDCWTNGNKKSKCTNHTPQHTSFTFNAMIFSAIILREHMSTAERNELTEYFNIAYKKYIKPQALESLNQAGFYEWGDGGIGVLAYAHWTNDHNLAYKEIIRRKHSIVRKIESKGYLNNNSYRGNRGYWYHTLGADSIFGYALLARSYGIDLFKDEYVGPELRNLALKVLEGDVDYNEFTRIGTRGKNVSKDPGDARPHMHQMAVSLPSIMAREFGMAVTPRYSYTSKVKWETIDKFIGFNASCYYSSNK